MSFHTEHSRLPCYGRVRQVHPNGTYTVDLVNGSCKAGVGKVLRCSEEALAREAAKQKRSMHTSMDAYAEYDTRNAGTMQLPANEPTVGCAVFFFDAPTRRKVFGRVRNVATNGMENSYTIDLVSGGGVREVARAARCSEEALRAAAAAELRCGRPPLKTGRDQHSVRKSASLPSSRAHTPTARCASTPSLRGVAITSSLREPKQSPRAILASAGLGAGRGGRPRTCGVQGAESS